MSNGMPVLDQLGEALGSEEEPKQAVTSEIPENVKNTANVEETSQEGPKEEVVESSELPPSQEEVPPPQGDTTTTVVVPKKRGRKPKVATDQLTPADPVNVPRPSKHRGRPRVLSVEDRKATQIFLTKEERELAEKIGGGQMSQGIRKALEAYVIKEPEA